MGTDQGAQAEPRRVSGDEILRAREEQWRPRLRGVSLVAEVEVKPSHAEQTLAILGSQFRQVRSFNADRAPSVLREYPAVLVMSMVQMATDEWGREGYWPPLAKAARLTPSPEVQAAWGNAFLFALQRLQLPSFEDLPDHGYKYVGRILMHSGIPTFCLPDYFSLLIDYRSRVRGASGASFIAWASHEAERDRLFNIDKPVVRFLRYGGDYAVDVAERCLDLLDDVTRGGDGSQALLPERFVRVARDLLSTRPAAPASGSRPRSLDLVADAVPRLVLDPYGRGVMVRLPASSDAPDGVANWQVTVDGVRNLVHSRAMWPGSDEPAPSTYFTVLRPSRAAMVTLHAARDGLVSNVPIVDDADPILFFSEDGEYLSSTLPLPRSAVWVLYPMDKAGDLSFDGTKRVVAVGLVPGGWSGWHMELVDLADVRSVRLTPTSRLHTVRGAEAARVVTGPPISALTTPYGTNVLADLPRVELPDIGAEVEWEVAITDGHGHVVNRRVTNINDVDVWAGVDRPLLGSYQVQVRGPWGRSTTRRVVISEGLRIDCRPEWRRFDGDGLKRCDVQIAAPPGLVVDRTPIALDPGEVSVPITISSERASHSFVLTPPHMSVFYESPTVITQPSVRPLTLDAEDLLEGAGTLTVRIGAEAEPTLYVRHGESGIQQVPPAMRVSGGLYRFDLARIVDTIRAARVATLSLDPDGLLVVGVVRPRKLAATATLEDGDLVFDETRDITGLTAAVYATRAPWRTPVALAVLGGRATLPAEYRDAGPLLVSLFVDDPWVPSSVPAWPPPDRQLIVSAAGRIRSADHEEDALSAFLADESGIPDGLSELDRLWVIIQRAGQLRLADRSGEVIRACQERLRRNPALAMKGFARSGIDPADAPAALVSAGVVAAPVVAAPDGHVTWTESPLIAALTLSNGLEDPTAWGSAADACGRCFASIVHGLDDPDRAAGQLNEAADLYANMPRGARQAFLAAASIVPSAVLDRDARASAVIKLIERRGRPAAKPLLESAGRLLREGKALLQQEPDKRLFWGVDVRQHPRVATGWHALSALSLAFAAHARLASRGHEASARWIERELPHWTSLARLAPELTTIDIVLAELLCIGAERRGRGERG